MRGLSQETEATLLRCAVEGYFQVDATVFSLPCFCSLRLAGVARLRVILMDLSCFRAVALVLQTLFAIDLVVFLLADVVCPSRPGRG